MNIVFHLGLHCTDAGLLIRSILQNRSRLARLGVAVPGPLSYRELIGETSTSLRGASAPPETEAMLVEAIVQEPETQRVILSNENFLCRSDVALGVDSLYPKAIKSAWLRHCFPSHEVEFALALRNPAGFIPDLISGVSGPRPPADLLRIGLWIEDLWWSDMIYRIADANPNSRILVWCHEDTPFIWSQIQRQLTGCDASEPLDGELDMAETIMTCDGYQRLSEFLAAREVSSPSKRLRALSAFLEAHAIQNAIETEIDLPGWTSETVEALTEHYEEDVETISRMPGVTFIAP